MPRKRIEFDVVDGSPVPLELADEVKALKARTGATLNSCDRSAEAEPVLRRFGKLSQRQLYENWLRDPARWNPANPPGFSTHERRNDGSAYPGRRGARLEYWQVGMDWSDPSAIVRAAARRGWIVTVTYPTNAREAHHLNFRKEPELDVVLRRGDEGPEVEELTKALARLLSPKTDVPYLDEPGRTYGRRVAGAVRRFQAEHHQKVDGIYGPQTATQLEVALREQRERERRLYRRGDRGPEVERLAKALAELLDRRGRAYLATPRARYDRRLEAAVVRFQEDHRLEPDGVFGPRTRRKLYRALEKQRASGRDGPTVATDPS